MVVFLLITWSLANAFLPVQAPGQSSAAYTLVGAVTAGFFLAGLVAHELGHALLARSLGVRVRGITLWLFGGVASFESTPSSPGAEAAIAGIGPLVSVLIGGALLGVAALLPDSLPAFAILWLGWINLSLAAFNLIPAFPLDGGRILSALLWRWSGDRVRGTARAARVGRVLSGAMILLGVGELLLVPGLGGLWLIMLGWFLFTASRAEESSVTIRHALAGVRVRDVMSSPVVLAPDWITIHEFLENYTRPNTFTTFPLRNFDGKLSGMVRLHSLLAVPPDQRQALAVREVAQPLEAVPRATPDELLIDLLQRLAGPAEGRVIVMDGEQPIGIVTPADITRGLQVKRS